jgi:hypothetical protein
MEVSGQLHAGRFALWKIIPFMLWFMTSCSGEVTLSQFRKPLYYRCENQKSRK